MSLPKRPPLNQPIPNADIPNTPEQYIVKAPYWDAVVSGNLTVSEDGTLSIEGSTTPPLGEAEVQGPYWNMPLGNGLGLWRGEFRTVEPEFPPYGCRTDVITTGVTDFTDAWRDCTFTSFPGDIDTSAGTNFAYAWCGCSNLTSFPALDFANGEDFTYSWAYNGLTSFPQVDTGKGSNFGYTWYDCINLVSFPPLDVSSGTSFEGTWFECFSLTTFPDIDVSSGTNFAGTWGRCTSLVSFPTLNVSSGETFESSWLDCSGLTSFPTLDVSNGTFFYRTWEGCSSLTSFPALDVSSGTDFFNAWNSCTSLTSFPAGMFDNCLATNFQYAWQNCALSQESVDNILLSIDTAGQSNGTLSISGGTSAAPSATGLAAKASLEGKGWTVTVNAAPLGGAKPAETKKTRRKRARDEDGQFVGDDPSTPDKNEAWVIE